MIQEQAKNKVFPPGESTHESSELSSPSCSVFLVSNRFAPNLPLLLPSFPHRLSGTSRSCRHTQQADPDLGLARCLLFSSAAQDVYSWTRFCPLAGIRVVIIGEPSIRHPYIALRCRRLWERQRRADELIDYNICVFLSIVLLVVLGFSSTVICFVLVWTVPFWTIYPDRTGQDPYHVSTLRVLLVRIIGRCKLTETFPTLAR